MPTKPNPQLVLDLESKILRALCTAPPALDSPDAPQDTPPAAPRAKILEKLRPHRWQDPEHRVVFEALTLLPGRLSTDLRDQLPAQATRMGFPDVNWPHYFAPTNDHTTLETLIAKLEAATHEERH